MRALRGACARRPAPLTPHHPPSPDAPQEPFCILPLQALCEAVRRDMGIAEQAGAEAMAAWPGGLGYESQGGNGASVRADGMDSAPHAA